ncbi:hypothetical protein ACPPVO_14710 [Dactylosporangium sp. McL0621]|uniref:hypothetical protein n=1 Tax=Dactylosporangium sp. McL0621 TaxID=3415678 RepID=UPI003CF29E22
MARSSDERWVVVVIRYTPCCDSDEFHLRSRAEWFSREAPHPLAVVGYTVHKPLRDQLEVVRFELPGGGVIEVYTNDGAVHRTFFDPAASPSASGSKRAAPS